MKNLKTLIPATLLMMMALSPLAQASAKGLFGASKPYVAPSYAKPTYHAPKPTYHAPKPTYHAPKPTYNAPKYNYVKPAYVAPKPNYVKPTYHAPKPNYVKPTYHAPKYKGYVKPTYHAPKYQGYVKQHGVKFTHGYYYTGKHHKHWTKRCWLPNYGTWCWYCPATTVWYYWCGPKACYYPINYITVVAPVVATPETAVVPPGGETLPEAEELPEVPTDE